MASNFGIVNGFPRVVIRHAGRGPQRLPRGAGQLSRGDSRQRLVSEGFLLDAFFQRLYKTGAQEITAVDTQRCRLQLMSKTNMRNGVGSQRY